MSNKRPYIMDGPPARDTYEHLDVCLLYSYSRAMERKVARIETLLSKLRCQSGLLEWMNMHCEPLADELAEAASAER